VTTASSMAKAELNPRVINVKKSATAQKLAPGICSIAVGRVWNPIEKPPTSGTSGPGNIPVYCQLYAVVLVGLGDGRICSSIERAFLPVKPTTPYTAKAAMFSKATLLETMAIASTTALLCFLL
jgi:hypothetical protein